MGPLDPSAPRHIVTASLAASVLLATPAAAQVARLAPTAPPVELVDPSERISGNAAAGVVIVRAGDAIGSDRLWAYLSAPIADKLELRLASIDGRYYAEIEYGTVDVVPGWVALDLSLREFAFLEKNYTNHLNEIAVLLSDAAGSNVYPVTWGAPHRAGTKPPSPLQDGDTLRVYMNTERANAFVVVDNAPAYCTDASSVSAFKFNAICEVPLGAARAPAEGNVIEGLEIQRRAGTRRLEAVTVGVLIRY